MTDEQLIFIVSQPRAGSTLLQSIISNNDDVNTKSEPWILLNFISFCRPDLVLAKYNQDMAKDAIVEYFSNYPAIDIHYLIKELLFKIYEPMLLPSYKYVLDKTPRYYEILDEILFIFPKAKIILIKRDPIEVVKSIITTWNHKDIISLSSHYRDIMYAPFIIHEFYKKHKNKNNIYLLNYENLIDNSIFEVKKIYKWLNISYTDKVFDFYNNKKLKGKFGDPYVNMFINNKISYRSKSKVSKSFQKFIDGYANYLSNDFLEEYGGYHYTNSRSTKVFNLFKGIYDYNNFKNRYGLKKEIKFKILRWFL